jgi:hypothetical protein
MQKGNHLFLGLLIGCILPALSWFVIADQWSAVPYLGKPGVTYLIAAALNLILLRVSYKKEADQTGNGIMIATFIFVVAAFILKIEK